MKQKPALPPSLPPSLPRTFAINSDPELLINPHRINSPKPKPDRSYYPSYPLLTFRFQFQFRFRFRARVRVRNTQTIIAETAADVLPDFADERCETCLDSFRSGLSFGRRRFWAFGRRSRNCGGSRSSRSSSSSMRSVVQRTPPNAPTSTQRMTGVSRWKRVIN